MKKIWIAFLLALMFTLSSCSQTEENADKNELADLESENEQLVEKIKELEEQINEQNELIAEQEENIKNFESFEAGATDESSESVDHFTPVMELGETYSNDDYDITVKEINYHSAVNKGPEVFFSIKNNSDEPLENPGALTFKLEDEKYEEEFNRLGYTINFDPSGFIYEGEERSGSYHYLFERDVKITEVTYHLSSSGITQDVIATWVVE